MYLHNPIQIKKVHYATIEAKTIRRSTIENMTIQRTTINPRQYKELPKTQDNTKNYNQSQDNTKNYNQPKTIRTYTSKHPWAEKYNTKKELQSKHEPVQVNILERDPGTVVGSKESDMMIIHGWWTLIGNYCTGCFFTGTPPKVPSTEKLIQARLRVSRTIYVNVDSPNLLSPAWCKKRDDLKNTLCIGWRRYR